MGFEKLAEIIDLVPEDHRSSAKKLIRNMIREAILSDRKKTFALLIEWMGTARDYEGIDLDDLDLVHFSCIDGG